MAKAKVKKEEASKALAVIDSGDWPVLAAVEGEQDIGQMLSEMGVTRFDLDKVVVPAGGAVAFEVESLAGVEYEKEIDCIIAFYAARQRAWYRVALEDGDGNSPPDCASENGIEGFGVVTHEDDEAKSRHECAVCPWDQFETAATGTGKACSEKILLYAFNVESMVPFVVQVPATSLKAVRRYVLKIGGTRRKLSAVVTKIALVKKEQPTPHAVMTFQYVGDLDDDGRERMAAIETDLRTAFAPRGPVAMEDAPANEMD